MDDNNKIALLEQQLSHVNADMQHLKQEKADLAKEFRVAMRAMQSDIDTAKGSSNAVRFLIPGALAIIAFVAGTYGFGAIRSVQLTAAENHEAIAVIKNDQGDVKLDLANDEEKFEQVTAHQGLIDRAFVFINEHEDEIDHIEEKLSEINRSKSALAASADASFTEVETQIRSINTVMNVENASTERTIGLLWKKVYGEQLPAKGFYPVDIPAKATTTVGEIKNGN